MLKVNNIETWYDLIRALHGISFEVKEGDIVALLGSNGAGKSTTLKTIMRLLYDLKEEQPEKGTIEFMGERIDRKDTDEIVRMGISYVPEGREVFPELSVLENIMMGAYTRRDRKGIKDDMENVFNHFPILKERTHQEAGHLSGGEQQMLAIGRALMSRPKLLMLDEPSLGLSPLLTRDIFQIIREINQKDGVTILLVEQNVNMALKYANFAFLMENGRIVRADRPEVLREDEDVKEFYLGIAKETSVKGYKRYRRKVRFRIGDVEHRISKRAWRFFGTLPPACERAGSENVQRAGSDVRPLEGISVFRRYYGVDTLPKALIRWSTPIPDGWRCGGRTSASGTTSAGRNTWRRSGRWPSACTRSASARGTTWPSSARISPNGSIRPWGRCPPGRPSSGSTRRIR